MVFHTAVVEDIGAYLRPPFDLLLSGFHFGLRLTPFLEFQLIELAPQVPQGVLSVLRLVACLGVLNDNLVRLPCQRVDELVMQPHAGFHFVHVLTSGTGAAERIPADARRIHFHLDRVVNQRYYEHGCERSHSFALCVVRTHADQTVYAVLALEIAVSHVAFDIECHGLDTRFVAFLQVLDRHFVVMFLAVPLVHAHQLLRPVLRFRAACSGHDLQHRRHLVFLVTQHVLHLQVFHLLQCFGISRVHLFFRH